MDLPGLSRERWLAVEPHLDRALELTGPDREAFLAALDDLAAADPPLAELVDLKFFGGFSLPEIAAMRGVSPRTTQRQWEKARLYLQDAIRRSLRA